MSVLDLIKASNQAHDLKVTCDNDLAFQVRLKLLVCSAKSPFDFCSSAST